MSKAIKDGNIYFYGHKAGYIDGSTAYIKGSFYCGELKDWLRSKGYTVKVHN